MAASIFIPACINRLNGQNSEFDRIEHVIEALASGIYLGLLMLFMIPETIDDFSAVWSSKIKDPLTIYTIALSSLCLGLFLVAIVEYIAAKVTCCIQPSEENNDENSEADTAPLISENNHIQERPPIVICPDCVTQANEKESSKRQENENEVWLLYDLF